MKVLQWVLSIFTVLLMSFVVVAQDETTSSFEGKRVLFVDSYHEGYAWTDGTEAGLRNVLDNTEIELRVIHLDTKRNSDPEFRENAAIEAMAEIEAFDPDVVIVAEDNAQKYLVVPYLLDTDLPIVFTGVNWDASVYGYPASNVTGMVEIELVQQLIDHLQQYAQGNEIAYLAVRSTTEEKAVEIYQERFFDGDLQVHFVETFDEFKLAFVELQDEVDILFLGNNAGIDYWDDDEAETFFAENTRIPTGSVREWTAPYALISLAKIAEEQGEWAGETILRILEGTPVSDIPPVENKRGSLILNLDIADQLDVIFPPSLLRNATIHTAESESE